MEYGVLGFLEACGSTDGAEASAEDQVSVASPQPGATRTTRAYKAKDYSGAKAIGPLLTGRDRGISASDWHLTLASNHFVDEVALVLKRLRHDCTKLKTHANVRKQGVLLFLR